MQTIQSYVTQGIVDSFSQNSHASSACGDSLPENLANLPIVNGDGIAELLDLGGAEFVHEIINAYVEVVPGYIDNIFAGVETEDFGCVERAAHALKSSSSNLGTERLSRICLHLELASVDRDWGRVERWVLKLESAVDDVMERLAAVRSELPSE